MFCVNCGNELEEGAQSCPLCNKRIEDESITPQDVKDFAVEYSKVFMDRSVKTIGATQKKIQQKKIEYIIKQAERSDVMTNQELREPVTMAQQQGSGRLKCPRCQNENLQIIQETSTKGRDMSASKGCCGYILLGPFGLLCGLCGKGKQMKTTTYWICPMCGNKFKA